MIFNHIIINHSIINKIINLMKIKSLLALSLVICFLFSCRTDLVEEAKLVGKWQCFEIERQEKTAPLESITFEFNADSTYHYYGESKSAGERGIWYTLEDKLYITPDGGTLMAVMLGINEGSTAIDTIRFHQNRGGKAETWHMLRK